VTEKDTKERILDAAEELMLEHSYHSVGLNQILKAVQVPKGSFYHYFDSKEQFGVEMLRHYMESTNARKREQLFGQADQTLPLTRLFAFLDTFADNIERGQGQYPCLVLKLAAEVSGLSEAMREELVRGFQEWISYYQQLLVEAVQKGQLPESTDTEALAQVIQDQWTGATERSVVSHTAEPARKAIQFLRSYIDSLQA